MTKIITKFNKIGQHFYQRKYNDSKRVTLMGSYLISTKKQNCEPLLRGTKPREEKKIQYIKEKLIIPALTWLEKKKKLTWLYSFRQLLSGFYWLVQHVCVRHYGGMYTHKRIVTSSYVVTIHGFFLSLANSSRAILITHRSPMVTHTCVLTLCPTYIYICEHERLIVRQ